MPNYGFYRQIQIPLVMPFHESESALFSVAMELTRKFLAIAIILIITL